MPAKRDITDAWCVFFGGSSPEAGLSVPRRAVQSDVDVAHPPPLRHVLRLLPRLDRQSGYACHMILMPIHDINAGEERNHGCPRHWGDIDVAHHPPLRLVLRLRMPDK